MTDDDEPVTLRDLPASTIRRSCPVCRRATQPLRRSCVSRHETSVQQHHGKQLMWRAACCRVCSNCSNSDHEALRPSASSTASDSDSGAAHRSLGSHRSIANLHAYTIADAATAFPPHDSHCWYIPEKPTRFLVVLDRLACDRAHSSNTNSTIHRLACTRTPLAHSPLSFVAIAMADTDDPILSRPPRSPSPSSVAEFDREEYSSDEIDQRRANGSGSGNVNGTGSARPDKFVERAQARHQKESQKLAVLSQGASAEAQRKPRHCKVCHRTTKGSTTASHGEGRCEPCTDLTVCKYTPGMVIDLADRYRSADCIVLVIGHKWEVQRKKVDAAEAKLRAAQQKAEDKAKADKLKAANRDFKVRYVATRARAPSHHLIPVVPRRELFS